MVPFAFEGGPLWFSVANSNRLNWWMVEPWRALCRHSLAGDFEGPVRKPAPLSNHIPLGGVVRFGPPQLVGLTKISMNYRTLAAHLQLFIDNQKNIANRYNGEDDRAYEESDK